LVVFLHGDVSAGGPADYMDNYAPAYASPGVVTVRMLRPGYYDSNGVTSTGGNGSRLDTYTTHNVQAVAYGLAALQQHYKASKLVVVGHSGGASIAATILGKYPGLIDATALMACPCDLRAFAPTWGNSLSALDWVAGIPLGSAIVSMTGTLDTQVPVVYTQPYVNALVARGILAQQIAIPSATHSASTIFTQSVVQNQIRALIQ
ncbi:MAG: alpha/beta hydrolase family protein, partial [Limnohabitans sp.]